MKKIICVGLLGWCGVSVGADLDARVSTFLGKYCFECHDGLTEEAGLDLERFVTMGDVFADRAVWGAVYEKVESTQMPPPKRKGQPAVEERREVLEWIEGVAAAPDPVLGARDPGKPVLRRLNRLEYNNTVRDLLGMEVDVFMFPERLPVRKGYFDPAAARQPDQVEVNVREYGQKYPVLLPMAGLPAENRAAHGYNNRGDVMNVSPLLLEKCLALAGEIVNEPTLPFRSRYFASLIGVDPGKMPKPRGLRTSVGVVAAKPVESATRYAPKGNVLAAGNSDVGLEAFRKVLVEGGGVFDVGASLANSEVAGKGGLVKVKFGEGGGKLLTINPNEDLWLVPFSTAEETSGEFLIANQNKGEKVYELTFEVKGGSEVEKVVMLGVCVLSRRGQSGEVVLVASCDDGSTVVKRVVVGGHPGNVFVGMKAPGGSGIRRLEVDGSGFSGDYVLIDDLGFVTAGEHGAAREVREEVEEVEPAREAVELALLEGTARERLAGFVERAFRREVDEEDVGRYFGVYEAVLAGGKSEADAMREAVRAVLASPGFLFLDEGVGGGGQGVRALTGSEIANRMSYFLWSSMPDEELFGLARSGALMDAEVRRSQVRRMLRDVKGREISESFAVQWLRLDQLYTAKPDGDLFRSFYAGAQGKNTLHASLLVEALLLFETVMLEDRSILDLIDADYTWLNPRLIAHYGLEDAAAASLEVVAGDGGASVTNGNREVAAKRSIKDNQWFRVPLEDRKRGGVMTMGGPLTVTSLPFRTSPVKRGAWLLETVFNRPPAEPKVAFAIEDDTKEAAGKMSVRQRFEAHRNKAACYSCHVRLDPPGFALEQFDAIGAWREKDGADAIDARGVWGGVGFDGPEGFKAIVAADPREFTRGFVEHLLSYALGRELEVFDMPAVAEIEARCEAEGWRFGALVEGIVGSYPFLWVRE